MLAAIDAGSNTLRMLIGRVAEGKVVPELYMRRICRLAGGFTNEEGLSPEAKERTLFAFQEFAETCKKRNVQQVRVVGTAAFRQAVNGKEFASEVVNFTELPLEIISGENEAKLMTVGVLSALEPMPEHALIVDIGGGSTEFVLCSQQKVLWSCSIPLGVVQLTERCASQTIRQQVITDALESMNDELVDACTERGLNVSSLRLVGTAGTVTTLAALDLQMTTYNWQQINNYTISLAKLQHWQSVLTPLTPREREALPGMETGRGDLIMAGIEIMLCLMQKLDKDVFTVSDFGILEGLLLSIGGEKL